MPLPSGEGPPVTTRAPGRAGGRWRWRSTRAGLQDRAADARLAFARSGGWGRGRAHPTARVRAKQRKGACPATPAPPVWQVEEDVLDGSVTVRFHDGGEDVVPDGRRLYAAESIRMTAWDADPGRAELDADVIYRWQERDPALDGELTRIEIRAVSQQRSTV